MSKMLPVLLLLALVSACVPGGESKRAAAKQVGNDHAVEVDRGQHATFGENEARSPFVGDRVVKLNAIVQRALDAINEFDRKRADLRAAVDAGVATGADDAAKASMNDALSDLDKFYDQSKAALDDLLAAEEEMKAAEELYNEPIFAGMVKFVTEVETELREEKASIEAIVAKAG